jgi:hypothetical protein
MEMDDMSEKIAKKCKKRMPMDPPKVGFKDSTSRFGYPIPYLGCGLRSG